MPLLATVCPMNANEPTLATQARLGPPAKALLTFFEEPHLLREKRQFASFLKVDLAHTVMLAEQGIITPDQAGSILSALRELQQHGVEHLSLDPRHGSLLFQIEQYLFRRVGEGTGGRMHT